MATTQQSMKDDGEQFGAAFDEETPAPVEQTEDEAFGLNLPAVEAGAEGDGETEGGEAVTQVGEGDPAEELPAEPPAEEVAVAEAEAAAGEDDMPPMTQAEKSWEGRLRAREAELKALAAELEAKQAEGAGDAPGAEEIAAVEEAVESGEITPEEAMRQLEEDFGPSFVKMIVAIAGKSAADVADGKVSEVGSTLAGLIDDIKDSRAQRHFKEILRVHPDFKDVAESEEFNAWVAGLAPEEAPEAHRVIDGGDSDEINALLTKFKSGKGGGDSEADEQQLDDAEGVRSTGLRLPDAPEAGKDDFAAAWDEHA